MTPGRRQLALWTLLLATLAAATIWRARSRTASFSELATILPRDVSVLIAFTAPPLEAKSAARFRQSQTAIVSYLFDGFSAEGAIENLGQIGIDDTRPILAGAMGHLGFAPQRMRESVGSHYASIPQNWFLLVPVESLTKLTGFFVQSRHASTLADSEGGVLGTIRLQTKRPTFALPEGFREQVQSATGDELPSHLEIYYASVEESQYVVLSTSRACVAEGLAKRKGASTWRSLEAEIQATFGSHRGTIQTQVSPSLFPEWKSLSASAVFNEGSTRVSIEVELGATLAIALAPRTLSFPLRQERPASGAELYFELAPEHVEEAATNSLMKSLAQKLFGFDDKETESFNRLRDVIARFASSSRVAEAAQLFFTPGRLGSPGWVLTLPADRAKALSIATELQLEFYIKRVREDTAELIQRLPKATKAALIAELGTNRFYAPVAQILARIPGEAPDLEKWGDYAVELETGQLNEDTPPIELSKEPYREQIDGVTIEYLTPPIARSAESGAETKDARRRRPSFCFDEASGRLFFGDAPDSLRHALIYFRGGFDPRRLTEPHHQTLARIACDVRASAENSVALDNEEWLTWMIQILARIGAQTAQGELNLAGRQMTLSLTLSLR
jgi:hypothetical protein